MQPVIALVGRPNVGKSTLFNRLTGTRDALVADQPGLTRDRKYGTFHHHGRALLLVDTGGLSGEKAGIDVPMAEQAWLAVSEAHLVVFLVDGRAGLTPADEAIAERLRTTGKPVILAVNKTEGVERHLAGAEFHALGLGEPFCVSAAHGHHINAMAERINELLPPSEDEAAASAEATPGIRVAMVGRPNVGKSTLINRMLGEERVLVYDMPGTTRDSIFIPFERDGHSYTLIDTAGVRRRARVDEMIEKFSVIKTLQAVEAAHVVVLVIDAQQGITDQDLHLLGLVLESGRALIIAVNKWDGLEADHRDRVRSELSRRLSFVDFTQPRFISALHGSGVGDLFDEIRRVHRAAFRNLPTPQLTRVLEEAVATHQPPLVRGRRIKLRYAHQGGHNPPLIIIHGNQTESIPGSYTRFLVHYFRDRFHLQGTPVRIEYKGGKNPFAGKRNLLTPRQIEKRRRLKRHVKKQ